MKASSEASESILFADRRARIAMDLGAESCRVTLLRWTDAGPVLQSVARIANAPYTDADGALRWPLRELVRKLHAALLHAADLAPEGVGSIGVDGWAVDFVQLDEHGRAAEDPFCYRDERTLAAKQAFDALCAPEAQFAQTGVQPMRINTLYQLIADRIAGKPQRRWLLLPEYLLHSLGGEPVAEFTNASHTGLVDAGTRQWSAELLERASLDPTCAPRIVAPGSVIGRLRAPLAEHAAFRETVLVAPACHDTASAIATLGASDAYIICGTWSLVGIELSHPLLTERARHLGFTNLGSASGGFCFHTNINGMWMLKQCIDAWTADGRDPVRIGYSQLLEAAEAMQLPDSTVFSVDAPELLLPGDMPGKICRRLQQETGIRLASSGADEAVITRLILNSLAHRYARAIADVEELTGRRMATLHVLGGGARNALLLRLIADRTGRAVKAGAVEASTLGNFALQFAAQAVDRASAAGQAVRLCAQARWLELEERGR